MLGYTNAYDAQGINQWIYGRIYNPGLHPDPAISNADWLDIIFRGVTVNTTDYTLTWYNITGVESFRIYAFKDANEINPVNAEASAVLPVQHNTYVGSQWEATTAFDLSELSPALKVGSAYYLRIQGMPQQVQVLGQEPLMWGAPTPLSNPVQVMVQSTKQ